MVYKLYNLSFFFLILLATVANAANGPQITGYQSGSLTVDKTYNYRTTLLDQNFLPATDKTSHIIDIGYTIHLDYVFKWKLSILMGEPVVIGWVSYKPTRLHSLDPDIDSNVFSDEELLKKIGLTEFTMAVRLFLDPNNVHDKGAIFVVDTGSAGKPYIGYSSRDLTANGSLFSQFSSFNTPGSPDWDKLFTNISSATKAKKYFTDITTSTIKRNHSYYRYDVKKVEIDNGNIDQAIYKYLQGLEKNLRDKEKTKQKKLQEQNKKQVDEFDDALGQTESVSSEVDDFLSEEATDGAKTLDDLLAETEKSLLPHKEISSSAIIPLNETKPLETELFCVDNKNTWYETCGVRYKSSKAVLVEPKYYAIGCSNGHCLAAPVIKEVHNGSIIPYLYYPRVFLIDYKERILATYEDIRDFSVQSNSRYASLEGWRHDIILDMLTGRER